MSPLFNPAGGGAGISLADALEGVYPIGSIYISIVATNPGTVFGMGTWVAFGAGKVLVGLDAEDEDFDAVEETGGAKTVASSAQSFGGNALATHQHDAISAGTPAGSVAAPVFSGTPSTDIVNHTHQVTAYTGTTDGAYGTFDSSSTTPGTARTLTSGNPVSGGVASYTPAGTNNAPAFSGDALATHQHAAITAGTPAGTNTPGAATSVVQPYITVYMFKRTA